MTIISVLIVVAFLGQVGSLKLGSKQIEATYTAPLLAPAPQTYLYPDTTGYYPAPAAQTTRTLGASVTGIKGAALDGSTQYTEESTKTLGGLATYQPLPAPTQIHSQHQLTLGHQLPGQAIAYLIVRPVAPSYYPQPLYPQQPLEGVRYSEQANQYQQHQQHFETTQQELKEEEVIAPAPAPAAAVEATVVHPKKGKFLKLRNSFDRLAGSVLPKLSLGSTYTVVKEEFAAPIAPAVVQKEETKITQEQDQTPVQSQEVIPDNDSRIQQQKEQVEIKDISQTKLPIKFPQNQQQHQLHQEHLRQQTSQEELTQSQVGGDFRREQQIRSN